MATPGGKQPGVAVRRAALRLIQLVEGSSRRIRDLAPDRLSQLSRRDQQLAREIAYGVVRWRLLLDHNILRHARKSPPLTVLQILRIAVYQLGFLKSVPAHAAVDTAISLLKEEAGAPASKFGNAVLRKISRTGLARLEDPSPESLSINTSHPLWLVKKISQDLPRKKLEAVLNANNEGHPTWLRVALNKTTPETRKALQEWGEADVKPEFPYFKAAVGNAAVLESPAFREGKISIQDPSSWFAVKLLDPRPGDRVLDLCAAPGGKTSILLEHFGDALKVYCADLSPERLSHVKDITSRQSLTPSGVIAMDANSPAVKGGFSKVLLDAPCSNFGVIRRRPEVKWRITPEALKSLAALQSVLLERAAALVAPGGSLVYATCSPLQDECLGVITPFLNKHSEWQLDPAANKIPEAYTRENCFWIYPGETPWDGFFAARLTKTA